MPSATAFPSCTSLRGRVGRSNRRAYAYLLVPPDTELTEIARKRLAALKEFSDLGAGFKIAALDLELRGAGNLLGGEQHGHINSVGFDTYVRLLEETVRELKGEEVAAGDPLRLNLGLDIRIPPDYIADENQRLRAYRQIANAADAAARDRAEKELEDRYGPVPEAVQNLLEYSELKTLAEQIGIEAVDRRHNAVEYQVPQGDAGGSGAADGPRSRTHAARSSLRRDTASAAGWPDGAGGDPGIYEGAAVDTRSPVIIMGFDWHFEGIMLH